ncbi:MAG TPA: ParB/Srx family N-terminal domain-containing protein, partial [Microvirga sp.]|nr:ParB/Srx family N-terminal domain-containing protein [Microvirga sp.]
MREPTANSVSVLNPGAASPASHTVKALHRDLKLAVEYVPIESLKTYKRAPRTHSPAHIEQLEDSIRAFGFVQPIMVDADGEIVGGHGMFEATHKAGYRSVPVVRLTHLDEAQKHTLRIALNPLAEKSGWNQELLAREFKELLELDLTLNLDFDLGNIVKREWLCSWAERPSSFDMVVYLLDLVRGRFEVPELRRDVLRLSQA